MRIRTAIAAALTVALAGGALSPALAAPKPKPVTKEYVATAFPPDPSHAAVTTGICNTTNPTSQHNEEFKVPFPGTLVVDLTGFQGDWDLALYSDKGALVASSAQDLTADPQTPEKMSVKLKKKGAKYFIRACNFAGGPTANVKYVHTSF